MFWLTVNIFIKKSHSNLSKLIINLDHFFGSYVYPFVARSLASSQKLQYAMLRGIFILLLLDYYSALLIHTHLLKTIFVNITCQGLRDDSLPHHHL